MSIFIARQKNMALAGLDERLICTCRRLHRPIEKENMMNIQVNLLCLPLKKTIKPKIKVVTVVR